MATNILMPALSPTMTEGTLARWLKAEGDRIKAGDIIAEIETDKATMEVEAVDEGILGRILVPAGTEGVKVNQPIAVLVADGEAVPAAAAPAPSAAAPPAAPPPPAAPQPAAAPPAAQASPAPAPPAPAPEQGRVIASPLARRMAQQAGLDLRLIRGSGPNGRVVKADVEAALSRGAVPAPAAAMPAAPAPLPAPLPAAAPRPAPAPVLGAHRLVPHSTMRKVIARRLSESKRTIPHFYVSMDIRLDALLKLRADINARSPKEGPDAYKLSVNDLLIKAAARALRRHPQVNASWTEEGTALYEDVDISVAVAVPEGLITPVIRQADRKGVVAISQEMKDLAARARAGKLKPEEYQGGGFSISNMGMYGVSAFSAIINPPQAGILAVSAGEQRPVVVDGALAVATVMTCTLSVDHRIVDGALAAEWLGSFKGFVEDPLSLLL
ncbi:MAG: pyruvate dehydrogenase complex dihydrolipoamide acetyltransferase [Acetobacteraceae bacterium]|nr:pyruvate dehydrogenase complex dihydrolipoamide acetyltransferase [Acetobacteraceae bacterium]